MLASTATSKAVLFCRRCKRLQCLLPPPRASLSHSSQATWSPLETAGILHGETILLKGVAKWRIYPLGSSVRLRTYSNGQGAMNVFDRNAKRMQKNRAAVAPDVATYDYLRDEVAAHIVDRVCDVSRFFSRALDVGCGRGHIAKHVTEDLVGSLYQCDIAVHVHVH